MSYNNTHSVMLGNISDYLNTVCKNAYQQGRADAIDEIIPKVIDLLINADVISEKNRITDTNWLIEQIRQKGKK